MPRVLLVDDDRKLLSLLERGFRFEGFDVRTTTRGSHSVELAQAERPDVVVLDIGMPDLNGFDVCRQLRLHLDVPVIMLTARDDVDDKVRALDLGADDYVSKPFAFDELVARVRAVLRRRTGGAAERVAFADLVCDVSTREVRRGARIVALTPREFALLVYFLRHPRQVLTRDAILQAVWEYELVGDTKVVDVYIGYLRQKLGSPQLIQTVRGVGYALKG